MREEKTINKYAQALLESAESPAELIKIKENFKTLIEALDSNPDFKRIFLSPVIPGADKNQVVSQLFRDSFQDIFLGFTGLICARNRASLICEIYLVFEKLFENRTGRLPVKVYTSLPLKPEQICALKNSLQKKYQQEIILEGVINENLLGGAMLKIGDKVIDGSVRQYLNQMRESL